METIFGVKRNEAVLFIVCQLLFAVLVLLVWNTGFFGLMPSIADAVHQELPFLSAIPGLSELPDQSISRLFISAMLYLFALIYALSSLVIGGYRSVLGLFLGLSVLSFAAWVALNYWIIAGFLNATGVLLYAAVTIVLLGAWGVFLMFCINRDHDASALFLMRFGLGLGLFITITQILALLTPEWRSPTQGIPVLYTLTLNGFIGIFLAGVGGNMLWRDRRQALLATGRKRR